MDRRTICNYNKEKVLQELQEIQKNILIQCLIIFFNNAR